MKIKAILSLCVASAIVIGFAGCKKQEPTIESTTEDIKSGTEKAVDAVKDAATDVKEGVQDAASEVKEGAEKAMDAVKEKAEELTTPSADSTIDKAKALVAEGKYADALAELNKLSGMTLSEAQQAAVDALKEQIQKAMNP